MKKTIVWMLLLLLPVLASCHKEEQKVTNSLANANGHVLVQDQQHYGIQAIAEDEQILPCDFEQIVYDETRNRYLATKEDQTFFYDQTGIQQTVIAGTLFPSFHQKGPAYGIVKEGKLALVDGTATLLTEFCYETEMLDALLLNQHTYYLLKQGEFYGVVDDKGAICIPFQMNFIKPISSTTALQVEKAGRSALFQADGIQVSDFLYDLSEITYQEHIGYLISKDNKWGILDEQGKEKVPFQFTNLNPKTDVAGDENGFLIREQTTHYYDPSGKEKLNIPGKGELFYQNRALVWEDSLYQLIDETGTLQKTFPDATYMEQHKDILVSYGYSETQKDTVVSVYDLHGTLILPKQEVYTILTQSQSPLFFLTFKQDALFQTTAYDHSGREQFQFEGSPSNGFTSPNILSTGFLYYDNQQMGMLSNQGDILIEPQYRSILEFSDFYLCTEDHHSVLLDKKTYEPSYQSKEEVYILPFSS